MNFDPTLRLYRRFGIEVRVHWILILWFVLAFTREIPRGGDAILWITGACAFLFVTTLLHEYGHCAAGRWFGLDADRIVLWPLGGLAFVESPHRPSREAWVAAAGPLTDLVIILAMLPYLIVSGGPVGSFVSGYRIEALYDDLYATLFAINLDRFVFNLLPAIPMDMGRVLRAALWSRLGLVRATEICTWVTRACVAGLIVLAFMAGLEAGMFLFFFALYILFTAESMRRESWGREAEDPDEPWSAELPGASFRPDPSPRGPGLMARWREERERRRAEKLGRRSIESERELDRLLEKVHRSGMSSLSSRERRFLRTASQSRKRAN